MNSEIAKNDFLQYDNNRDAKQILRDGILIFKLKRNFNIQWWYKKSK